MGGWVFGGRCIALSGKLAYFIFILMLSGENVTMLCLLYGRREERFQKRSAYPRVYMPTAGTAELLGPLALYCADSLGQGGCCGCDRRVAGQGCRD